MREFDFTVNGYRYIASYEEEFIDEICLSLIEKWKKMAQGKRIIVFLAAPPAVGKSTLAMLFESLSDGWVQALGMDGFHHFQSYILEHEVEVDGKKVPMKSVKGCPESFDFKRFEQLLLKVRQQDCLWPLYNRRLHDVEEDKIQVSAPIVLIEGNYLLLDEKPWNRLKDYCDDSIFISADEQDLKQRLIQRKMQGGVPAHEAVYFYMNSDRRNILRIMEHRLKANVELKLEGNLYIAKKSQ